MAKVRCFVPVLVGALLWAAPAVAQVTTGTITGRVVNGATQQPISGANVTVEGTQIGAITRADGGFLLVGVPAGSHRVTASLIGYSSQTQDVTVSAGGTATVRFALGQEAILLDELVAVGYGTQRRAAITGSVATIDAAAADVGVITNANEMIQGRAAGVRITLNNGEPGAGAQIRIRGGTSISASNEPLYVIDGVAVQNISTEAAGIGLGGEPSLPRSPLNLLNPSDIASITILKDAAAAAIYGSRGANGVVLIETKKGTAGDVTIEYDGYVSMSTPARSLDVLTGDEYRDFVQQQAQRTDLTAGQLAAWQTQLEGLGSANTDWEQAVTRSASLHNHNLSFTGGGESTRYLASINYRNEEGVALSSGFERLQGRLNATHRAWDDRIRIGLNLMSSHVTNNYLPYETGGGFEGGVFVNMAVFNPTQPVTMTDPVTGQPVYYEIGPGSQSVRNPVALAEQIDDVAETTRTLGNFSVDVDLLPGLTGRVNLGVDRSESVRQTYFPKSSPAGAPWNGRARQVAHDNRALTLQGLLTLNRTLGGVHGVEITGGYEFNDYTAGEFGAEGRGFVTDAFSFNNLGGGSELIQPFSWRENSRLVSFFSRANYSYDDRYFLTGVLRYDGSSRFGADHRWAAFPAVSGSWRLSEESFLEDGPFSDLRLRAGWGLQGNEAVPAYAALLLLQTEGAAQYVFGNAAVTGVAPGRLPNPDLRWEQTAQFNVALDFGFAENRYTGSVEYYVKNTKDLLLEVPVPQPALVPTRIENVGQVRNHGIELSLDAQVMRSQDLDWSAGLVFAANRNEVVSLGPHEFITTGFISGQGQTGQVSQRIMAGYPLGTFYGPMFRGVATEDRVVAGDTVWRAGAQLFACQATSATCVDGETTQPTADDFAVLGDANPDFTFGLTNRLNWGNLDASVFIRGEVGQDIFNNTALVYATKGNALQGKNFLASALDDPTGVYEPAIFSSRWIEDGSFLRLQNVTVGYTFDSAGFLGPAQSARVYVSGDNLLLLTGYSGLDPEVYSTHGGLAVRGIDYLAYPRARTFTAGIRMTF